jgi:hypothetical protein
MQSTPILNAISDDELLRRLAALLQSSRHTEADLVAHIGEVDERRLYAREASPSMWAYCTERLHLSGAEAYLRIVAARASRQHPVILEMLADGRLHLTAIALLAPHLTPENRETLLRRATHKSKREVEELLAELEPRPDAPALIRKLPDRRGSAATRSSQTTSSSSAGSPPAATCEYPVLLASPSPPPVPGGSQSTVLTSAAPSVSTVPLGPTPTAAPEETNAAAASGFALRLDEVVSSRVVGVSARAAVIEPLSPTRYKVQFTASAHLREKLERLQVLMRSSIPDGDLAAVIEGAVTEKLERLESRRFGRTKAPRKGVEDTDVSRSSRHVPAAVRRDVHERDEGRCRYVDGQGRRCTGRVVVQYHHRRTFALGGDHSPANVSLLCPGPQPLHGRDRLRPCRDRRAWSRLGHQEAPVAADAARGRPRAQTARTDERAAS